MNTSSGLIRLSPSKSYLNLFTNDQNKSLIISIKCLFLKRNQTEKANLHFEGETHLGLNAAGEDLEHEVDEAVLLDAAIAVTLASKSMEAVGHDSWQVDILHKGHLVNGPLWIRLRLRRSES